MNSTLNGTQLIEEAQKRLALIHGIDPKIRTSKNKLLFGVNGYYFELCRSIDKVKDIRKAVCECPSLDFFPVVFNPVDEDTYTEADVELLTSSIDAYFIETALGLSPKSAICNRIYFHESALKPLGIEDFPSFLAGEAVLQAEQRPEEEGSRIILAVRAEEKDESGAKLLLLFLEDFSLEIQVLDFPGNSLVNADDYDEDDIKSFFYPYTYDFDASVELFFSQFTSLCLLNYKFN